MQFDDDRGTDISFHFALGALWKPQNSVLNENREAGIANFPAISLSSLASPRGFGPWSPASFRMILGAYKGSSR